MIGKILLYYHPLVNRFLLKETYIFFVCKINVMPLLSHLFNFIWTRCDLFTSFFCKNNLWKFCFFSRWQENFDENRV